MPTPTLYYIADPMCSWCWGFQPTLESIIDILPEEIDVRYVMGGLAKDSDEPMPADTLEYVKQQWQLVTDRTGAQFNWDFWTACQPRRSTYPACRAAIAAGEQQGAGLEDMFHAIQRAYYMEARNPSDLETLISLAAELKLDVDRFSTDIVSPGINDMLYKDFELRRSFHADKFPTVILDYNQETMWLAYGYEEADKVMDILESVLHS